MARRGRGATRATRRGCHHEKLVAPVASEDVTGPQLPSQPSGSLAQDLVAGLVAVAAVQLLEAIEVEHDHVELRAQARRGQPSGVPAHELAPKPFGPSWPSAAEAQCLPPLCYRLWAQGP